MTSRRPDDSAVVWSRTDLFAMALFVPVTVVMTHPLWRGVGSHLPQFSADVLTAYWQNWWLERILLDGHDPNWNPFLFFPTGLDTTVQPRRWLEFMTWFPFSRLWGPVAAFNLDALLGLALSGCGAYLLVRELTRDRFAAWLGGAFFAYYPAHVERALGQPNTGQTQWLAFFAWMLVVTLVRIGDNVGQGRLWRRSFAWIVGTALVGSLNAYVNLKLWLMAAMLGGLYVTAYAALHGTWRHRGFVVACGVLALTSVVFALPMIVGVLRVKWLAFAIDQVDLTGGVDLRAYVSQRPGLPPFVPEVLGRALDMKGLGRWPWGRFAVGAVSAACVLGAVWSERSRRRGVVAWLVVAVAFLMLSLGTTLHIDKTQYPALPMPYRLLQDTALFRALRNPFRFALAFSLAWAVLVGYGVSAISRRLSPTRARWVFAVAGVLMLAELAVVPVRTKAHAIPRFYTKLAQRPQPCAVIDLPMGRQHSKTWMLYQTVHGHPIVEGMAARMPPRAYEYIATQPLLRSWHKRSKLTCPFDVAGEAKKLVDDGFCYAVVHGKGRAMAGRSAFLPYFAGVRPSYRADPHIVFSLARLAKGDPCKHWKPKSPKAVAKREKKALKRKKVKRRGR